MTNLSYLLKRCFLFGSLVFAATQAIGQSDDEVPPVVLQNFQELYPGEDDPDFEQDSHGYWEAHFKIDGERYRADFNADGSWVETENDIKTENLPQAILNVIEREYEDVEISEVEHVMSASKGEFYDVEFEIEGKKIDVEFREDGSKV